MWVQRQKQKKKIIFVRYFAIHIIRSLKTISFKWYARHEKKVPNKKQRKGEKKGNYIYYQLIIIT